MPRFRLLLYNLYRAPSCLFCVTGATVMRPAWMRGNVCRDGYRAESAIKDSQGDAGLVRERIVDGQRSRIVSKKFESDSDLRLWLSEI